MGHESFKIQGYIIDKQNQGPIEGLLVRACDVDCLSEDDFLGESYSNHEGEFEIRYRESDFVKNILEAFVEGGPDLVLQFYDSHGELLHTSQKRSGDHRFEAYELELDYQKPVHQREIQLLDIDAEEEVTLSGFRVQITSRGVDKEEHLLLDTISDSDGKVELSFTPRWKERLQLRVSGMDDEQLHVEDLNKAYSDSEKSLTIKIKTKDYRQKIDVPLTVVEKELDLSLSSKLKGLFNNHNIHSLADLRSKGAQLKEAEGLAEDDKVQLDGLLAHARLNILSGSSKIIDTLIHTGYHSLPAIVNKSKTAFVRSLKGRVDKDEAYRLYSLAEAKYRVLNNILTEQRTFKVNGYSGEPLYSVASEDGESCDCPLCRSSVSPLAYLADLLDYCVGQVTFNNSEISLNLLSQEFHQPFRNLPKECSLVEEPVRQVRLCIESLSSYIDKLPNTSSSHADKSEAIADYLPGAYQRILIEIGTSADQLRLVRYSEEEQEALEARLGIGPTDGPPNDKLQRLFFEGNDLTERALERLFGLQQTQRDPLSTHAKIDDEHQQLEHWRLQGVAWRRNTDENGRIYVRLREDSGDYKLSLYRDAQRNDDSLVSYGESSQQNGKIELHPGNSSGPSGNITISYQQDDDTIEIAAVPEFTAWRLGRLRSAWYEEDWPSSPYTPNAASSLPVLDPDLIGPEDIRNPQAGNIVFEIWRKRRDWVDTRLQDMQGKSISEAITFMTTSIDYNKMDGTPNGTDISVTPWANAPDMNNLSESLAGLGLNEETVNYLSQVYQDEQNESGFEVPSHIYSILVQEQKKKFFSEWIVEEQYLQIQLWPEYFRRPKREPVVGAWPAVSQTQVLVDSEIIPFEELPDDIFGEVARLLWTKRKEDLELLEQMDFTTKVEKALGSFPSDSPFNAQNWGEFIDKINDKLNSNDATEVSEANAAIGSYFHMTLDQFEYLSDKKYKVDGGTELTSVEIQALNDILLPIYRLDVASGLGWPVQDDQGNDISEQGLAYWKLIKARLPEWRASFDARQKWQSSLETNSQPPLIDPDQISEDRIRMSSDPVPALLLWQDRQEKLSTLFDRLKLGSGLNWLDDRLTDDPITDSNLTLHHHPLGFSSEELAEMSDRLEAKQPLERNPEDYGLVMRELLFLLKLRKLLILHPNNDPTTETDWDHVRHILVQAEKRRYLFPRWRFEEREQGIILDDENFLLPDNRWEALYPRVQEDPSMVWRIDVHARRDWQERLETRIDQRKTTIEGLKTTLGRVEETTLPALRDKLAQAAASQNLTVEEDRDWVSNTLLIQGAESGCRVITRVAQAIETLQVLLWGLRTKQFEDQRWKLEQEPSIFDEEWKWLGSYATWRTAMFVFLYPENFLLPTLRRELPNYDQIPIYITKSHAFLRAFVRVVNGQGSLGLNEDGTVDTPSLSTIEEHINRYIQEFNEITNQNPLSSQSLDLIYREAAGVGIYETSLQVIQASRLEVKSLRYYLSIQIALTLQNRGEYIRALDWYRKVYDYHLGKLNPDLEVLFQDETGSYNRFESWLQDPMNPHEIAQTRSGADLRFVLISIIRCLLDYAEAEFAIDSQESLARARELFLTAQHLLNSEELKQSYDGCDALIGKLIIHIGEAKFVPIVIGLIQGIAVNVGGSLRDLKVDWNNLLDDINAISPSIPHAQAIRKIKTAVEENVSRPQPETMTEHIGQQHLRMNSSLDAMLENSVIYEQVQAIGRMATAGSSTMASPLFFAMPATAVVSSIQPVETVVRHNGEYGKWVNPPHFDFCIPPNPILRGLNMRASNGLFKLRHCMNIAGMPREVEFYAAATDAQTGMPTLGAGGQISSRAFSTLRPTQYRYKVLAERARQLAETARQMESTFLSFLERLDQETHTLMAARQQAGMAWAGVELQELRVTEAENGQTLAEMQKDRVVVTMEYYQGLIDEGPLGYEEWALFFSFLNMGIQFTVAAAKGAAFALAGILGDVAKSMVDAGLTVGTATGGSLALAAAFDSTIFQGVTGGLSTLSSNLLTLASWERRAQEWEYQKNLADQDFEIAQQQITLAEDRLAIVEKERDIAHMSAEHADDMVNFLRNKFTNTELYAWMSGELGNVYRYFLQHAASIARIAQSQLAFERQEPSQGIIQGDYWTPPTDAADGDDSPNRRGLTGSARLLQDITRLDQHAFTTDQRKLQLSKTFSLARLDPLGFQRFLNSGVIHFDTLMESFDRDFPGLYLRLIKQVRVSVLALIPPSEGIRATLSTTRRSRVVVKNGSFFEEVRVKRDPESVAYTSPINANGLFEFNIQPEMLLPFEGLGVDSGWTFSIPRPSNPIDYKTIADVMISIDYTALESFEYRQQLITQLDPRISAERPFSLRHHFPDEWYHLHNPIRNGNTETKVRFRTRLEDFPPNLNDLTIGHVTLLFVQQGESIQELEVDLRYTEYGDTLTAGGLATTVDGTISTRLSNGPNWMSITGKAPDGEWELTLPNAEEILSRFDDILLVITFAGETSWETYGQLT